MVSKFKCKCKYNPFSTVGLSLILLLHHFQHARSFSMSMSSSSPSPSPSPSSDLRGKVVAQRFIYRLSPTKSSVTCDYTIEERQYFTVGDDRSLEPLGDKCFLIRGPEGSTSLGADADVDVQPPPETLKKNGQLRVYTRIGPSLYQINNVAEDDDDDEYGDGEGGYSLGSSVWDSSYVMVLYCLANPDLVKGRVLEVGSGIGIGGILSCIGAALAQGETEYSPSTSSSGGYQSIEDIANTPMPTSIATEEDNESEGGEFPGMEQKYAPVPKNLAKLLLTDSHDKLLNKCYTNVQKSSFPPPKVEIKHLDWNARIPNELKCQYDLILGCDCAYYFPLVNPLSRTVAYTLQTSPYDTVDNDQRIGGKFVHIGPEHRESIHDLRRKLSKGYRMNTRTQSLVLERLDLVPLFLDSMDDINDQIREETDLDGGAGTAGFVEYQNVETSYFTSLVGYHHEDYDGFNGEYFFPADTGREGNYGGDGTELDYGYGTAPY